jgi:HPt (histidine-containing phosphotransfer) domain-containing protein
MRPPADSPAAPPAGEAPYPLTLDPVALGRLRELDPDGRHGVIGRVLATFDTSLTRMLEQLHLELDQRQIDAEVVRSVAHTLKASSAAVGAQSLARACAEVEAQLRDGGGPDPAAAVHRLLAEGEAALVAVRAMLRA